MNQTLRWDQNFSVNIAEMDHQHLQLFRTIAELEYAIRAGRGDSVIDEVLDKMIQHTINHFAAEEELMERHRFPGLAAHRSDHQLLAHELATLNLSNLAGRPDIPSAVLAFLQAWLRDHILKTDQEYSEFLNARGVS